MPSASSSNSGNSSNANKNNHADDLRRVVGLWKQYKKTGAREVRNQLIENYLPLVRNHAERLKAKLPSVVQVDDLTTAGVLGLIAIIAYNHRRRSKRLIEIHDEALVE